MFGFSIADHGPVQEPAAGATATARFEVRYLLPAGAQRPRNLSVRYADLGTGSATSGTDYEPVTGGVLNFGPDDDSMSFDVVIKHTAAIERARKSIHIGLSEPMGEPEAPPIARSRGTVEIIPRPVFSIDSPKVLEPGAGETSAMRFTVSIPVAALVPVSVDYRDTGTGTATSGADYRPVQPGTLEFPPGTTERPIVVEVSGDADPESAETVIVGLSNPVGGDLDPDATQGTGTIFDEPEYFIEDGAWTEPPAKGERLEVSATVRREPAGAARGSVTLFDEATEPGGTAGTATPGRDYEEVQRRQITFDPGVTSQRFPVVLLGDGVAEGPETIRLGLSRPRGGAIRMPGGGGTLTIRDACADTPPLQWSEGASIPNYEFVYEDAVSIRFPRPAPGTVCPAGSERYIMRFANGSDAYFDWLGGVESGFLSGTALAQINPPVNLYVSCVDGRGVETPPLHFTLKVTLPELRFEPLVISRRVAWGARVPAIDLPLAVGGVEPIGYARAAGTAIDAALIAFCGQIDTSGDGAGGKSGTVSASRGRFLPSCLPDRRAAQRANRANYRGPVIKARDDFGQTATLWLDLTLIYDEDSWTA